MPLNYSIMWCKAQWIVVNFCTTFYFCNYWPIDDVWCSCIFQTYLDRSSLFNVLLILKIPVVILESFFKRSSCYPKIKLKIFVCLTMDISSANDIWCAALILEGAIFSNILHKHIFTYLHILYKYIYIYIYINLYIYIIYIYNIYIYIYKGNRQQPVVIIQCFTSYIQSSDGSMIDLV